MRFEFATAGRILFGPGAVHELGPLALAFGRRVLFLTGLGVERAAPLLSQLNAQGMETTIHPVDGEPTVESVLAALQRARESASDLIIGMGGGSAIDTGKAVAALLTNGGEPLDYLEVIGHGKPLTLPSASFIAIPTTAGTGSEVTRNAVLGSPEHRMKLSLRSPFMLPRLAIVDPELTYSLPPAVTASTGLDALTQLVEPYVSPDANPVTDAICREGISRAARSLRRAYHDGGDTAAREDMALASLLGGMALANARLGAVHGLASPLGGLLAAPHGAICARLLPLVMDANVRGLQARAPDSPALARYDEVARLLTGNANTNALDGARWVGDLCADLSIPPLSRFGLSEADIPTVVAQAQRASSTKGNSLPLTDQELSGILAQAL